MNRSSLLSTYKSVFLSGLATILPTILTLWVLFAGYNFVDRNAATPISNFIKSQVLLGTDEGLRFSRWFWDLPLELPTTREAWNERSPAQVDEDIKRLEAIQEEIERRFPNWVGFVIAVIAIFVVGFFTASFIGQTIWSLAEGWILKVPVIKSVYPSAKQMVDFLLASDDSGPQFNAVVAVEYPMRGQYAIGFITGAGRPEVQSVAGKMHTVFIPMAPTPITGFVIFVPEADCIAVKMTVDEAFKFYISGGVIGSLTQDEVDKIAETPEALEKPDSEEPTAE